MVAGWLTGALEGTGWLLLWCVVIFVLCAPLVWVVERVLRLPALRALACLCLAVAVLFAGSLTATAVAAASVSALVLLSTLQRNAATTAAKNKALTSERSYAKDVAMVLLVLLLGFCLVPPVVSAPVTPSVSGRTPSILAVISQESTSATALAAALADLRVDVNQGGVGDPVVHASSPHADVFRDIYVDRAIVLAVHPALILNELFSTGPVTNERLSAISTCGKEHCKVNYAPACLVSLDALANCIVDKKEDDPLGLAQMLHNWLRETRLYPVLFVQPHAMLEHVDQIANFAHVHPQQLKEKLDQHFTTPHPHALQEPAHSQFSRLNAQLEDVGHLHLSPAKPGDTKFVMFPVDGGVGFNNMRQVMTFSIIVAKVLGRGLMFPPALFMDMAIDLQKLHKHLPVARATDLPREWSDASRRDRCIFRGSFNPFSIKEIEHEEKSECEVLFVRNIYWSYPRFSFPFMGAQLERIYQDIDYHPDMYLYANELRRSLPAKFYAVHYRVGDRLPFPLFDCWTAGYKFAPLRNSPCLHTSVPPSYDASVDTTWSYVTLEEIVLNNTQPGDAVFVASNEYQHEYTMIFTETLKSKNRIVLTVDDLRNKHPDPQALERAHVVQEKHHYSGSCVDQLLCILADEFFATFDSSWDDFVIERRRWNGKPVDIEAGKVYDAKIHHFMTTSDRPLQVDRDILPNMLTKCPAGLIQSKSLCLCPANQRCRGPQCRRGINPKTRASARGFVWTCTECKCLEVPPRPDAPRFKLSSSSVLFSSAQKTCEQEGGTVATFDTIEEFEDASDACCINNPGEGFFCYVGLVRDVEEKRREDWRWIDGRSATTDPNLLQWRGNDGGYSSSTNAGFSCGLGLLVDLQQGQQPQHVVCKLKHR